MDGKWGDGPIRPETKLSPSAHLIAHCAELFVLGLQRTVDAVVC